MFYMKYEFYVYTHMWVYLWVWRDVSVFCAVRKRRYKLKISNVGQHFSPLQDDSSSSKHVCEGRGTILFA